MNKLLMKENFCLQKQVPLLVSENGYMRQQSQTLNDVSFFQVRKSKFYIVYSEITPLRRREFAIGGHSYSVFSFSHRCSGQNRRRRFRFVPNLATSNPRSNTRNAKSRFSKCVWMLRKFQKSEDYYISELCLALYLRKENSKMAVTYLIMEQSFCITKENGESCVRGLEINRTIFE